MEIGYIFTLHILGIDMTFPIFATSGIHVHSHLPRDVIHKNKEYDAYFTSKDVCAGKIRGCTTRHFTFSKIHSYLATCIKYTELYS